MPNDQFIRTPLGLKDEDEDISPLLKGLLIALLPSAIAWAALIFSAVRLGQAIHR